MKTKVFFIMILLVLLNIILLPKKEEVKIVDEKINEPNKITISLTGEVAFPGIYVFFDEIILRDVLNYAGKATKNADLSNIDLNEIITKDKKINIPNNKIEDEKPIYKKYDLNTVTFTELKTIPGITDNIAANIILYRTSIGRFSSLDELLNVKYIGNSTFEKINIYFTIS